MSGNGILLFLALWPMAGALACYILGRFSKKGRDLLADAVGITDFAIIAILLIRRMAGGSDLTFAWAGFCGLGLYLELDGFRALYGCVAAFMWMMTTVFSREYFTHYRNRNRYYMFMLLTLGATMGVFLSADLYTTFIFFEMMSFTSFVWVAHEEKPKAMRAAITYLAVAVIGGLVMLMGIFLLYQTVGTLRMDNLLEACKNAKSLSDSGAASQISTIFGSGAGAVTRQLYLAGGLMVFGFGAKAGMFPLHIWLPKAHPVAPAPSSALLSGILTKSGIFGILAVTCNIFLHDPYWGVVILVLGEITMFLGALLAVFSVDFKRTLACSSMSQIGFILIGVGMQCMLGEENALAVSGTVLHMVNHSLFKLDLFMVAGVVFMNTHKLDLNEIRGFGREKPLLKFAYLMGALGIGGIPLWNGYISKTLLHESIVEYAELVKEGSAEVLLLGSSGFWTAIEWIFLISGGMTIAYMTKLYVAVFLEKNEDAKVQKKYDKMKTYWNTESKIAILGTAVILPVLGLFPHQTMDQLAALSFGFMHGTAAEHAVRYFSLGNLKGAVISIAIGAALYFGVIRTWMLKDNRYVDRWPQWLDLENVVYRPVLLTILPAIFGTVFRFLDHLPDSLIILARYTTHKQHYSRVRVNLEDRSAIRLGLFLDHLAGKRTGGNSHVPHMVELEERTARTGRIVAGSLSFGLMLASVGLISVLVYLIQAFL